MGTKRDYGAELYPTIILVVAGSLFLAAVMVCLTSIADVYVISVHF